MSFRDLEVGRPPPHQQRQQQHDPSQALASGIFQINTAVSSFSRLVNSLGTPKDTLELRDRLHKTRLHIGVLVKDTTAKLKQAASETDQHLEVSAAKKITDAKLAKDFQLVLREFQKVQRLAVERETTYAPFVPKEVLPSSYDAHELDISSSRTPEQRALLLESKRQEVVLVDEIIFNEASTEEIEVNEMFKDLAVLVHEQGAMIDDVSSNIERSHAEIIQATSQLAKAAKTQKSGSSLTCLLLLIFGAVLLIVIVVIVAWTIN
ncbi:syntaxin-22-like [Juglans microcarpa x Juglans regia]|uniref:syntaxin-22-like n=1 Tax=Juglans microcarpa x Juglans regia TaxID=2249226 RepID=UPI001B7EC690|nr:syntaxin-22-like [Juglans microcarpa x Juglans regia]